MPLIKDDKFETDPWVTLADDEALPEGGPAIISLDRWQAERETLIKRNAALGIRLRSDQTPESIIPDLHRFAVIALEFPKFTDGRSYSTARLLRERYGYKGELRAVGEVLRDQLHFMHRCGFDALELADGTPIEAWLEAKEEIGLVYQPAGDVIRPILSLRQAPGQDKPCPRAAPQKAEPCAAHRAY